MPCSTVGICSGAPRASGEPHRNPIGVDLLGTHLAPSGESAAFGALCHDQQFVALRLAGNARDLAVEGAVAGGVEMSTKTCECHDECLL